MAITSLVLGVLGNLCLGPISGLPAIILGHIAYNRTRRQPEVYAGAGLAIAGFILGYVSFVVGLAMLAIMAGMTLPALAKAKGKATEIACINNLKQIGLAARIYATDHNDTYPTNFASMSAELSNPRVLWCPADTGHHPLLGDWSQLTPANISYEFLTPGAREAEITAQPAFRCLVHGTVAMGDGSVQRGAGDPSARGQGRVRAQ